MVWFHVDDAMAFHPKAIQAGNAAIGLWVRAGAWATSARSDGFIPRTIARRIGTQPQIESLIVSGLWEVKNDGYVMHDWHHYQIAKSDIESRRESDRQRKREQRKRENVTAGQPPRDIDRSHDPPVTPPVTADSSRVRPFPSPPLPVVVTGGNESPVGSRPPPEPATAGPPNKFCKKHPGGTDDNCGACMTARKQNESYWQKQTREKREAEQQQRRDETTAQRDAIPNCRLCNDDGYRHPDHLRVCDHIDRTTTAANGIAKIRAALKPESSASEEPF
jgi:hypothetical protein